MPAWQIKQSLIYLYGVGHLVCNWFVGRDFAIPLRQGFWGQVRLRQGFGGTGRGTEGTEPKNCFLWNCLTGFNSP
jgi:hypothetical protein